MTILNYPVTRKALAASYRVTPITFTDWLHDIGIRHKKTLSPKELKKIIDSFGPPPDVQIKF